MNVFFTKKAPFSRKLLVALLLLLPLFFAFSSSCKKPTEYFDYVSELRDDVFLAESDGFSLKIYSVTKETPYKTDGIPRETTTRTEIYLVAPAGDKPCMLSFRIGEQEFGGDMSFDNVRGEYYFSCTLNVAGQGSIACSIDYGGQKLELNAISVVDGETLAPKRVLELVRNAEKELFDSLTDKYGFAGEIYLRLLYEDAAYYYVGVIDRDMNVYAFLVNAKTGKILAKRQS